MKRCATSLLILLSLTLSSALQADSSSQWFWHGAFPWVFSHAESAWWYMYAGTDGKFYAWKNGDEKWYSFDEASQSWSVLPGQDDAQEEGQDEQQDPAANTAGNDFTIPDLSLEMLWVEPGTFTMGSPADEADRDTDETEHQVTLTQGFYLGKYEVTQAQYEAVMTGNANGLNATPSNWSGNANRPVEQVSWDDVQVFLTRLNAAEQIAGRLPAGWSYVLPTESEWEYACRAGTITAYSWGNTIATTNANYWDSGINQTRDVGQYAANPWGFYDMHGNVDEWTADWHGWAYPTGSVTDPTGLASGSYRVSRGGSWIWTGTGLRSARRDLGAPGGRGSALGFRVGFKASQ